ncbi:clock-controlled-9 protein [Tuber brumale]|nr:clock-controlled-9 protein [Tuber brumale]
MARQTETRRVDQLKYIPEADLEAFRITKTNHNILQGVADPEARFGAEGQAILDKWMRNNAERYWLPPGGPRAPGAADVVIIDDLQMPALIPLIKKTRPKSKSFTVPISKSARTLWKSLGALNDRYGSGFGVTLDGLNKPLSEGDLRFYHHNLHNLCNEREMNHLLYPTRDYITQIARFDPRKGIPDVIESYRELCVRLRTDAPERLPPQLLIHGAIDDPDAEVIYNETIALLGQWRSASVGKDVIWSELGQAIKVVLNAMITTAKIVVQLSLRERFEVKVSEALHHGKPVLTTRAGGIPLQIEDGKSGFLQEGDLYATMSKHAKASVSDEVGTVSNAACWLYLAAKLARGEGLAPNSGWIMDMARAEAGQRYVPGEPILPCTGIDI